MNKEFFKRNKYTVIMITVFLLLAVICYVLFKVFFPNYGAPVYGDRLSDINKYKITDEMYNKVDTTAKTDENVTEITYNIKGKIVNVLVTVNEKETLANAKALATKIVGAFEKEIVSYYDIQIFLSSTNKDNKSFPIIGYKSATNDTLNFNKDR